MKKTILIFSFCCMLAIPSFAQNNMDAMRALTVSTLMQYGQQLYERGDFNGATSVFTRVLAYDSHQAKALKYLSEMGHAPIVIPGAPILKPVVFKPYIPAPIIIEKESPDNVIVDNVDVSNVDSLKEAIEAKKRVVEKLRAQVAEMRANLAAQSAK